jgi:hypothetical protein
MAGLLTWMARVLFPDLESEMNSVFQKAFNTDSAKRSARHFLVSPDSHSTRPSSETALAPFAQSTKQDSGIVPIEEGKHID